MANVLTVVWIVIAWVLTQTSIMVWIGLMLPNPVRRARERIERKPVATFFLGALFWGLTILIAGSMLKEGRQGGVQLLGWLTAGPMLAASVIGGAGVAQLVAARIQQQATHLSPLTALTAGAFCTALSGLLPVIGWVVFLPIVGFMSVGAGFLSLVSRREKAVEREMAPAAPAPESGALLGYSGQQPQQG